MRYFTPKLCFPQDEPADRRLTDKFGGRPEGFPYDLWPVCEGCGHYQSFGAQFAHDPERLDLGRPGRRLFVFQCAEPESVGVCEVWDWTSGANAAFVVEPENLIMGQTHLLDENTAVETEVLVTGWEAHDDGVPPEMEAAFFDETARYDIPEEVLDEVCSSTKLGSVPAWIQSADEMDAKEWRFVAQLDAHHHMERDGKPIAIDAANYGGGMAYVFVDRRGGLDTPHARVFWQC